MLRLFRSLRRRPGDHRSIFAEFAVLMVFVVADQLVAAKDRPRLGRAR